MEQDAPVVTSTQSDVPKQDTPAGDLSQENVASEKDTPATGLDQANVSDTPNIAAHPITPTNPALAPAHSDSTTPTNPATARSGSSTPTGPKAATVGGITSSMAGMQMRTTSPQPGSAPKKSVKHLECAYFFSPSGCKWKDPAHCLYAHHYTGARAGAPIVVEPGRPPVAGRNAERALGGPTYNNWRNSALEQGTASSPRPSNPQPHPVHGNPSLLPTAPAPQQARLRHQISHIHSKAQTQRFQASPYQNSPTMGKLNPNAAPYDHYKHQQGAGFQGRPVNTPSTSPVFSVPGGGAPADVFGAQVGGHPSHFHGPQGQYTLPVPPPGPTIEEFTQYQFAFHHMQQQLYAAQQDILARDGEMDQLRGQMAMMQGQMAAKDGELAAKDNEVTLLRKDQANTIDAWKLIDYNAEQAVAKARTYAYNDSRYLTDCSMKLNQYIVKLPRNDKSRQELEMARDVQISVVRGHIATMDNCMEQLKEGARLRNWLEAELAKSGDPATIERLRAHLVTSFVWKAKLH